MDMIGRFHPVILHLPIGILFLVFFLEIWGRYRKTDDFKSAISLGLKLGAGLAVLTSISGYFLMQSGGYEGPIAIRHQWLGIVTSLVSLLLVGLHGQQPRIYFPFFVLAMALLVVTGHYGGSLTHGEDFLFVSSAVASPEVKMSEDAEVYHDVVAPLFQNYCVSCHNDSKSKGDLRMNSPEALEAGGESGPLFISGRPQDSELMKRIHLPLEDENHMPPKSKKQLTDEQILLLHWWIESGAPFAGRVGDLQMTEEIHQIINRYSTPTSGEPAIAVANVSDQTLEDLRKSGYPIYRMGEGSSFVGVDFTNRDDLKTRDLKKLSKVREQLVELKLGFSSVRDPMMKTISLFPHLQKLYLQGTDVTTKGINKLKNHDYLSSLNLYDTAVDDGIVETLVSMPMLKEVYLWQSKVDSSGIAELSREKPQLQINYGADRSIFGDAALTPPVIIAEKDLFTDSLEVTLDLNFNDVQIYYTTDGTTPDTTSMLYTKPIILRNTSLLQAYSTKPNWKSSELTSKQFVKVKYHLDDITLLTKPKDKYKGQGGKTLGDLVKGSTIFTDGNWLGYEGDDLLAVIDLKESEPLSAVSVSALEAAGSWIFYPREIDIWTSRDGSKYDLVSTQKYPTASSINPAETTNFTASIPNTEARYIKVQVKNLGKNPPWHPNPGQPSWVFVDEIVVE